MKKLEFEYVPSMYKADFSYQNKVVTVRLASEIVDEAESAQLLSRRRVKRLLRDNLLPNSEPAD